MLQSTNGEGGTGRLASQSLEVLPADPKQVSHGPPGEGGACSSGWGALEQAGMGLLCTPAVPA